jgi:sec-independent protein translocase protein TatB
MFTENRFSEILIIGALLLIVVGPKDLPMLMRRVGQFVGKMRGMAAEFRASFDELARQSELEELRKEVEALRSSHDSAVNQIHASLDNPINGAFGEETPSFMMPLNPPPPTLIEGAEAPVFAPQSAPEVSPVVSPPKAPRKPRAAAPAKPAAKSPAKSASKTTAKPKAKRVKVDGEPS